MIDTNVGIRTRQIIKPQPGELTVMFFMKHGAKESYQLFYQQKAEIENDFGDKLGWIEEHDEKRVYLKRTDMKTKDEASWPEQHEWLASTLEKLEAVFRPRIE